MVSGILAAEECGGGRKEVTINSLFDLPFLHELEETMLVFLPATPFLFIGIEYVSGRCQQRLMNVLSATDLFEEEGQVFSLRKSSQLGRVIESDVDKALYTRSP